MGFGAMGGATFIGLSVATTTVMNYTLENCGMLPRGAAKEATTGMCQRLPKTCAAGVAGGAVCGGITGATECLLCGGLQPGDAFCQGGCLGLGVWMYGEQ